VFNVFKSLVNGNEMRLSLKRMKKSIPTIKTELGKKPIYYKARDRNTGKMVYFDIWEPFELDIDYQYITPITEKEFLVGLSKGERG